MFLKKIKHSIIAFLILFISMPNIIYAYSDYIIASGENIGIKVNSNGVLVVGLYEIDNKYPAKDSGIKIGDLIISINDKQITSVEELVDEISNNKDTIKLGYIRNDKLMYSNIKLYKENNSYKTGLYVKDSITGIGTLTYIDPNTKIFGALGHEISEKNTGKIIEVKDGSIFESVVTSIDSSSKGIPGSKNARFNFDNIKGIINENTNKGVFGIYTNEINGNLYKVGTIDDINIGNAKILTVINDNKVESFDINILKVSNNDTKSILFEVTDKRLLDISNGIVQGMSGSPIIQNDNIIGAVTHVVVDNPTKGYGILISNMIEEAEN